MKLGPLTSLILFKLFQFTFFGVFYPLEIDFREDHGNSVYSVYARLWAVLWGYKRQDNPCPWETSIWQRCQISKLKITIQCDKYYVNTHIQTHIHTYMYIWLWEHRNWHLTFPMHIYIVLSWRLKMSEIISKAKRKGFLDGSNSIYLVSHMKFLFL